MIQYDSGSANRLGNRAHNQDRGCLLQQGESILLLVADGMGGHKGGEQAAQEAVDCFRENFQQQKTPIPNPALFLELCVREAHRNIARLGSDEDPPYYPRTTLVACLIQENQAFWVHLGDSRLYLLRDNAVYNRTRDHTYIEELFRNQVITEEEMQSHPMRNYVTYCLGGPNDVPPLTIGREPSLQVGDVILLCTDGLWNAVNVEDLGRLGDIGLDVAVNRMAEEAERISYPHSDNITVIALRIQALKSHSDGNTLRFQRKAGTPPATGETGGGEQKLSQAIENIKSAIRKYGKELKRE